jgi:hypothetical protein
LQKTAADNEVKTQRDGFHRHLNPSPFAAIPSALSGHAGQSGRALQSVTAAKDDINLGRPLYLRGTAFRRNTAMTNKLENTAKIVPYTGTALKWLVQEARLTSAVKLLLKTTDEIYGNLGVLKKLNLESYKKLPINSPRNTNIGEQKT